MSYSSHQYVESVRPRGSWTRGGWQLSGIRSQYGGGRATEEDLVTTNLQSVDSDDPPGRHPTADDTEGLRDFQKRATCDVFPWKPQWSWDVYTHEAKD